MFKLVAGTLAALLMTTAPEGGNKQDRPHNPGVTLTMKDLDSDGDGKVSKDEFMAAFARLDRNQDGFLTADELSGSHAGKHGDQKKSKAEKSKSKPGKARHRKQ